MFTWCNGRRSELGRFIQFGVSCPLLTPDALRGWSCWSRVGGAVLAGYDYPRFFVAINTMEFRLLSSNFKMRLSLTPKSRPDGNTNLRFRCPGNPINQRRVSLQGRSLSQYKVLYNNYKPKSPLQYQTYTQAKHHSPTTKSSPSLSLSPVLSPSPRRALWPPLYSSSRPACPSSLPPPHFPPRPRPHQIPLPLRSPIH